MFLCIPAMEGEDELACDFTPLCNLWRVGMLQREYLPMGGKLSFPLSREKQGCKVEIGTFTTLSFLQIEY